MVTDTRVVELRLARLAAATAAVAIVGVDMPPEPPPPAGSLREGSRHCMCVFVVSLRGASGELLYSSLLDEACRSS